MQQIKIFGAFRCWPRVEGIQTYHSGELASGHLDDAGVVSLGDAEVLLVEVHQLHLVVGNLLLVGRLEHEGDIIGLILGLDGDDVIIGSTPSN